MLPACFLPRLRMVYEMAWCVPSASVAARKVLAFLIAWCKDFLSFSTSLTGTCAFPSTFSWYFLLACRTTSTSTTTMGALTAIVRRRPPLPGSPPRPRPWTAAPATWAYIHISKLAVGSEPRQASMFCLKVMGVRAQTKLKTSTGMKGLNRIRKANFQPSSSMIMLTALIASNSSSCFLTLLPSKCLATAKAQTQPAQNPRPQLTIAARAPIVGP
mmetsp:Transcript_57925/g.179763  ORF Transcript_57925/g.179763 Transcript_57925/m.179763 type:complete len:215 (+) Transcript_57925:149-793(+)